MGAGGADGGARRLRFVTAEIVEHDDLALGKGRGQDLFDVDAEEFAADRPVGHPRRVDAIVAQRGEDGEGLPMTARNVRAQPLLSRAPAAQRLHVGLHPRFVDERQTLGIDAGLARLPPRSLAGDVGARLLRSDERFL